MNWYYTLNEKVVGPLTGDTMMQLHACGMLTADTQVLKEGTEEWMRFNEAFGKVLVQAEPPTQAEMPETPIKFHCPHCDLKISAELADAGVSVSCPSCGIELVVPTESTRPQEFPSVDSTNRPNSSSHTDSRTSNLAEINRVTPQSPSLPDESFSENNPARHKFGTTLASFAKSAAHEVKVNSQIAVLKTRIENAKQIELRKAHYALGRKLYEARILLSMQGEIEELERQITEKGQRALIEENETKGAMLKRLGKNAAKSAESELLSLKLKQILTHLGELARNSSLQIPHARIEAEIEAILSVESKIRDLEASACKLQAPSKAGNGSSRLHLISNKNIIIVLAVSLAIFFWKKQSDKKDMTKETFQVSHVTPVKPVSQVWSEKADNGSIVSDEQLENSSDYETGFMAGAYGSSLAYTDSRAYEAGRKIGKSYKSSPIYTEGYNKGREDSLKSISIESNPYNKTSQKKNWLIWKHGYSLGNFEVGYDRAVR